MNKLLFVQLPPPRFTFEQAPVNIPLAAGYLAGALDADGLDHEIAILEPEIVDTLADAPLVSAILAKSPDILAFTLYVWNVERSLFIAAQVKRRNPDITVIVGGPEVTMDNEWLLHMPVIHAGVIGEGEVGFGPLLKTLSTGDLDVASPSTFVRHGGEIRFGRGPQISWDLRRSGAPYADGSLKPSRDGVIFLETVRGCPYHCHYCYYHKAFAAVKTHSLENIKRTLEFAYSNNSGVEEIYLMDPTFNRGPYFSQVVDLLTAGRHRKDIRLHTELRADFLTPEEVNRLSEAGLRSAEVGLQTINPTALKLAGRSGRLDKLEAGVRLLRDAGVEVTTGIILGLPGDTPAGFASTLDWLVQSKAYSVVHPFTLAVLPGTDFRKRAGRLGLTYQSRPPYYVTSTPGFTEGDLHAAMNLCEQTLDMRIDYIPPPSLVETGLPLVEDIEAAPYISAWIVEGPAADERRALVFSKAGNPFTFRFKGALDAQWIYETLSGFINSNPHTVLNLVFDSPTLPSPEFIADIITELGNPGAYANKAFYPLYEEGEITAINAYVIIPEVENALESSALCNEYSGVAVVVHKISDTQLVGYVLPTPALFSSSIHDEDEAQAFLKLLWERYEEDAEEVLFRDYDLNVKWLTEFRGKKPDHLFPELIVRDV